MQAQTSNKQYTYQDYLKINDDKQYELIGGDLILVPAPRTVHQRISQRLNIIITNYVNGNGLGEVLYAPTDVLLSENAKPQPDIFYISKERIDIIKEHYVAGAPDLVIEILSPSTASLDRVEKSKMYFIYGVQEYWIVDPDHGVVEVFTSSDKGWYLAGAYHQEQALQSPILGLEVQLKEVFSGLV